MFYRSLRLPYLLSVLNSESPLLNSLKKTIIPDILIVHSRFSMTKSNSRAPSPSELPTLEDVLGVLSRMAPLNLAEDWDNVGLLVEPTSPSRVSRIMLTIDLTEPILDEAVLNGAQLIISYHPPIFRPLKTLKASKHWKERIIVKSIENRIAIYSPHTALDAVNGGINDWLLSAFDLKDTWPIKQSFNPDRNSSFLLKVHKASLSNENLSILQDYTEEIRKDGENVQIVCRKSNLEKTIEELRLDGDSKAKIELTRLEPLPIVGCGVGRGATLSQPLTIGEVIERVKKLIGKDKLRVASAHKKDEPINSILVCAGSGGSVLSGQKADVFITGEMSHHEVLEAVNQNKTSVILCEHTNTERGYLEKLRDEMRNALSCSIDIFTSKSDEDPLRIV